MNGRERILATLKGEKPDKIGRSESLWSETWPVWHEQGLPRDMDMHEHFGWDLVPVVMPDLSLRLPTKMIEETDEYIHHIDANGVERKDWKGESGHTPHWLNFKLNNGADWMEYKERLKIDPSRLAGEYKKSFEVQREKGRFTHWTSVEAYESAWPVFGQVNLFTMMMEEPDVVKDVFMTYTDLIIGLAQEALDQGVDFDGAFFFGDVGYRNGLLFSPDCYDEMLFPAHKKMCDFFKRAGKPVILHSCGRIKSLIPRFIEAGFSAIQPLEAKCEQDIRELRKIHGRDIVFFGNMDIRKLSGTREDVREEVMGKLEAVATDGGYIFHSDHSVPPTVPLENYRYALELLDEFNEKYYGN